MAILLPISIVNAEDYTGEIEPLEFATPGDYEITLSNVTIESEDMPGILIGPGVNLTIILEGENTITAGNGAAGISVLPAYDSEWNYLKDDSASLTIKGTGNLIVTGGNGDELTGTYGGGAGIGGDGQNVYGDGVDFGIINIDETYTGTITATGGVTGKYLSSNKSFGAGAGIGTGGLNNDVYDWGEVQGTINIAGGTITATGGMDDGNGYGGAAGIGSGGAHGNGQVLSGIVTTISGGTVSAEGTTSAAGIGGGSTLDGGIINITGGIVEAISGPSDGALCGAGIGGGDSGTVTEINITGGKVTAGSAVVAGIGGGSNTNYSLLYDEIDGEIGHIAKITISGEDTEVTAYGGSYTSSNNRFGGPGIGSGYSSGYENTRSLAFDIKILDGAKVTAYGGQQSNSIGYGSRQFIPTETNPDPELITGYGISLTLGTSVDLYAKNQDNVQTVLVSPTAYNDSPLTVLGDDYLVNYLGENKYRVYDPTTQNFTEVEGTNANGKVSLTIGEVTLEFEEPDSTNPDVKYAITIEAPVIEEEEENNTPDSGDDEDIKEEEKEEETPNTPSEEEKEPTESTPSDDEEIENPQTGDDIMTWVYLELFGITGLLGSIVMYKKIEN